MISLLEKKTIKFSKRGIQAKNLTTGDTTMATLSDFGKQSVYHQKSQTKLSNENSNIKDNELNNNLMARRAAAYKRFSHNNSTINSNASQNNYTNSGTDSQYDSGYSGSSFLQEQENKQSNNYRNYESRPGHATSRRMGASGYGSPVGNVSGGRQVGDINSKNMTQLLSSSRAFRSGKLALKGSRASQRSLQAMQIQQQNRVQRLQQSVSKIKTDQQIFNEKTKKFSKKIVAYGADFAESQAKDNDNIGINAVGAAYSVGRSSARTIKQLSFSKKKLKERASRKWRLAATKKAKQKVSTQSAKAAAKKFAQSIAKALSNPTTIKGGAIVIAVFLAVVILANIIPIIVGGIFGATLEENANPETVSYIKSLDTLLINKILDEEKMYLAQGAHKVNIHGLERIKTDIDETLALLTVLNEADTELTEKSKKILKSIHSKLNKYTVERYEETFTSDLGYPYTLVIYEIFVETYTVRQKILSFDLTEDQTEILLLLLEMQDEEENKNSGGIGGGNGGGDDGGIIEGNGTLRYPLNGYNNITSPYGERIDPITGKLGEFHPAIDISAPIGVPISAALDGTVVFSGKRGTYGNLVILQHANGMQTYYAHCDTLVVSQGDSVATGQQIATVGNTGRSTGPHLHFEVRINNGHRNPMGFF